MLRSLVSAHEFTHAVTLCEEASYQGTTLLMPLLLRRSIVLGNDFSHAVTLCEEVLYQGMSLLIPQARQKTLAGFSPRKNSISQKA